MRSSQLLPGDGGPVTCSQLPTSHRSAASLHGGLALGASGAPHTWRAAGQPPLGACRKLMWVQRAPGAVRGPGLRTRGRGAGSRPTCTRHPRRRSQGCPGTRRCRWPTAARPRSTSQSGPSWTLWAATRAESALRGARRAQACRSGRHGRLPAPNQIPVRRWAGASPTCCHAGCHPPAARKLPGRESPAEASRPPAGRGPRSHSIPKGTARWNQEYHWLLPWAPPWAVSPNEPQCSQEPPTQTVPLRDQIRCQHVRRGSSTIEERSRGGRL